MRFFSFKTALGCFLMATMLFAMRDHGSAQDPITKEPAPAPVAETTAPLAVPETTDLEQLDNKIRDSAGKDPDAFLARAHANSTAKNYHRVIDDLDNYERLSGKDPELHAMRAEAKMLTGDFAGALRDFQAGALLGNGPEFRHIMYALALHATGNSQIAITELSQAIKKEPEASFNYDMRGLVYRSTGNRAAAMKDHDQSIKISPDNAYGYLERACTNYAFGDYAAAKSDFEKAVQFGPADSYVYRYYAYFLATCEDERFRDAKRAMQLADVALEHDPNDGFSLHAKACALALEGEYDVALGAGLRAREDREFARDPEIGGGVEGKAYLAAWKQGKPLFREPNKEK